MDQPRRRISAFWLTGSTLSQTAQQTQQQQQQDIKAGADFARNTPELHARAAGHSSYQPHPASATGISAGTIHNGNLSFKSFVETCNGREHRKQEQWHCHQPQQQDVNPSIDVAGNPPEWHADAVVPGWSEPKLNLDATGKLVFSKYGNLSFAPWGQKCSDTAYQQQEQQEQQQQQQQEGGPENGEQAAAILVQHLHFSRSDKRLICALLRVSKTVQAAVLNSCRGILHGNIKAYDKRAAKRSAAWVAKYGGLLRSISIQLPGHSEREYSFNKHFDKDLMCWTNERAVPNRERQAVEDILAAALHAPVSHRTTAPRSGLAALALSEAPPNTVRLYNSSSSNGTSRSSNSRPAVVSSWLVECHMPSPSPTILAALPSSIRSLKLGNLYFFSRAGSWEQTGTAGFLSAVTHLTNLRELNLVDEGEHPVLSVSDLIHRMTSSSDSHDQYSVNGSDLLKIVLALPALRSLYIEEPHKVNVKRLPGHVQAKVVKRYGRSGPCHAQIS